MADYIDRDSLLKHLNEFALCHFNGKVNSVICSEKSADVAPVRHGYWIGLEYDGYADGCPVYDLWECSECGEEVRGEDVPSTHPYCNGCGAKMDQEGLAWKRF